MNRICAVALLLALAATTAAAQDGDIDVFATAQWVNRIGGERSQDLGANEEFRTDFEAGGGLGIGINYFLAERWSVEFKGAALRTDLSLRGRGSDYVYVVDLGGANIYPINAVAQYHFRRKGSWQPYVGAGVSYVVVQDLDTDVLQPLGVERLEFDEQGGLVLVAGSNFWFADRWAVVGDARYVPLETEAETRFGSAVNEFEVRPLLISAGVRYRFR